MFSANDCSVKTCLLGRKMDQSPDFAVLLRFRAGQGGNNEVHGLYTTAVVRGFGGEERVTTDSKVESAQWRCCEAASGCSYGGGPEHPPHRGGKRG